MYRKMIETIYLINDKEKDCLNKKLMKTIELQDFYNLIKDSLGTYYEDKIKQDLSTMQSMNMGKKYEEILLNWVRLIKIALGMALSTELLVKQDQASDIDIEFLRDFFNTVYFPKELKALGRYAVAGTKARSDAKYCYDEQLAAVKQYPQMGSLIGCKYEYDETMIEDVFYDSCPICGGKNAEPYYCARQLQVLPKKSVFSPVKLWMKCDNCKNLYAYNFPVMKMGEINGHYTKKVESGVIQPRFPLSCYSDIFNRCCGDARGKEYLEVGIGNGEMLAVAIEMGFNVRAVEICKEDCEKVSSALDVDIAWTDFLRYETEKKFDLIVMGDILEHVSEPVTALVKAKSLMNDAGILWLSTPNYNSSFTRLKKFEDPMWNQKNHFTYFSYETIMPILEEVGLKVERYDVSCRYNGSMELICKHI